MQPMVVGFQLFTSTRRVCVYVGKMMKNRLRSDRAWGATFVVVANVPLLIYNDVFKMSIGSI